jgi:transposase
MYSNDLRWRAIVLTYIYNLPFEEVSIVLGPSKTTLKRWYSHFDQTGALDRADQHVSRRRVPNHVIEFISNYSKENPCFYIEELQEAVRAFDPSYKSTSTSTLCRVLRRDLNLTRKVLTKRVREAQPAEIELYYDKISYFYLYPEQLIFCDETSKDGRSATRRYAWSQKGTAAIVNLPAARGQRISLLASFSSYGFCGWDSIDGTYDRIKFHELFLKVVYPYLNPWPLPRSILILDNAKIHMYPELEEAVSQTGNFFLYKCSKRITANFFRSNTLLFASLLSTPQSD